MTAPEADRHYNQRSLPSGLSLRALHDSSGRDVNQNSLPPEFLTLDQHVSTFYSAESLKGVNPEDVFQFLSSAVSPVYVTGIRELIKTGESRGFETEIQFFRCTDRSQLAPVALAFKRIGPDGDVEYGLPNVTAILDTPEERLRGDSSSSGKKLTRATDGTAEEGESGAFGGKVTFETFIHPVRILISESTDTEVHRPFDVTAQFAEENEADATNRAAKALTTKEPFSFLAECVVHPHLTQYLSRSSQLFGARERAEIVEIKDNGDGSLLLWVQNPEQMEGQPLHLKATIQFLPYASTTISETDVNQ